MKIRKILILTYIAVFLMSLFFTRYFVKIMLFDQQTANRIILFSLFATITLSIINFIIINPILKKISELQEASKKNAIGNFTTIDNKTFVTEISLLLTDYNRMVEQLDYQLKQIRKSEKEKIEMVSNLSHDIKTPISSLIALGQALADDIIDEDEKIYYYQSVLDNAQRIFDLSEELFQIVASEESPLPLPMNLVWVDASVIKVLNAFKGRIDRSEREIVIEGGDSLNPIYSDESAIFRILYNIIDNSLKYSDEGTPIHITIKDKENQQMIQIAIKDFGQGIPEDEQIRIFERTYRVEKSRNQSTGGNGLGLSISQKLIENIGGKITVSSILDEGTIFYVEIPYNSKIGE